jgi:hypothetical protein
VTTGSSPLSGRRNSFAEDALSNWVTVHPYSVFIASAWSASMPQQRGTTREIPCLHQQRQQGLISGLIFSAR